MPRKRKILPWPRGAIPYAGHEDFSAPEADEPPLPPSRWKKHRYNKRNHDMKHLPDQFIGH